LAWGMPNAEYSIPQQSHVVKRAAKSAGPHYRVLQCGHTKYIRKAPELV
jgi:hypothetical protein